MTMTLAVPALAQDTGGVPQAIVAATTPLSAEQRSTVASFVEQQAKLLKSGDPEKVRTARIELTALPGRPGASETFQREYAALVRPAMENIVAGTDEHQAVNALIVLRALRSPEAVEAILARLDPLAEKRLAIRIKAASVVGEAVAEAPLTPPQVDAATRKIVSAASSESDWVCVLHNFRALAAIAAMPKLPEPSATMALRGQSEILKAHVARMAKEKGPSTMMDAVSRALLVVRDQFYTMPADRARQHRQRLAPTLVALNEVIVAQWSPAQGDARARRTYGAAISGAELLLKLSASSDLRQELAVNFAQRWEQNDKDGFTADLAKAKALLPNFGKAE